MEHRYESRQSVHEIVELWNGNTKYGNFETDNLCSGGIFIKNCQNKIGNSKHLTIKFKNNPNLSYHASRCGLVVHKNTMGIGLMWTHLKH
ncbi:hypothetical protein [uncultured Paraglaciecola sp.]|uniref:hypothetical protein n=1 Tax=uncultured Paraglaciecola sp. TaxID=1765024 RepID=UPI002638C400|nr:hypothetical protein [uncultured Paraglaciecola sp.]